MSDKYSNFGSALSDYKESITPAKQVDNVVQTEEKKTTNPFLNVKSANYKSTSDTVDYIQQPLKPTGNSYVDDVLSSNRELDTATRKLVSTTNKYETVINPIFGEMEVVTDEYKANLESYKNAFNNYQNIVENSEQYEKNLKGAYENALSKYEELNKAYSKYVNGKGDGDSSIYKNLGYNSIYELKDAMDERKSELESATKKYQDIYSYNYFTKIEDKWGDYSEEYNGTDSVEMKNKEDSENKLEYYTRADELDDYKHLMTQAEQNRYLNIKEQDGIEKAEEYYKDIEEELKAKDEANIQEGISEWAKEHPILATGANLILGYSKPFEYLYQLGDLISDGKIDSKKSKWITNISSSISQGITENLNEKYKDSWIGSDAANFIYQTSFSMLQFLSTAFLTGALDGGTDIPSLLIMSGEAAADTTNEALQRGLNSYQAFALGSIAGFAEYFTEKVSLDTLLNANFAKDSFAKYILKNTIAEGSEEGASSLINLIADGIISGDKNEISTRIKELMSEKNMSESDATVTALLDKAGETLLEMLGGAISGGVFGTVAVGKNQIQMKSVGKAIVNMGYDGVIGLIDAGLKYDENSKIHKLAKKLEGITIEKFQKAVGNIESELDIGDLTLKSNARDVGNLQSYMASDLNEQLNETKKYSDKYYALNEALEKVINPSSAKSTEDFDTLKLQSIVQANSMMQSEDEYASASEIDKIADELIDYDTAYETDNGIIIKKTVDGKDYYAVSNDGKIESVFKVDEGTIPNVDYIAKAVKKNAIYEANETFKQQAKNQLEQYINNSNSERYEENLTNYNAIQKLEKEKGLTLNQSLESAGVEATAERNARNQAEAYEKAKANVPYAVTTVKDSSGKVVDTITYKTAEDFAKADPNYDKSVYKLETQFNYDKNGNIKDGVDVFSYSDGLELGSSESQTNTKTNTVNNAETSVAPNTSAKTETNAQTNTATNTENNSSTDVSTNANTNAETNTETNSQSEKGEQNGQVASSGDRGRERNGYQGKSDSEIFEEQPSRKAEYFKRATENEEFGRPINARKLSKNLASSEVYTVDKNYNEETKRLHKLAKSLGVKKDITLVVGKLFHKTNAINGDVQNVHVAGYNSENGIIISLTESRNPVQILIHEIMHEKCRNNERALRSFLSKIQNKNGYKKAYDTYRNKYDSLIDLWWGEEAIDLYIAEEMLCDAMSNADPYKCGVKDFRAEAESVFAKESYIADSMLEEVGILPKGTVSSRAPPKIENLYEYTPSVNETELVDEASNPTDVPIDGTMNENGNVSRASVSSAIESLGFEYEEDEDGNVEFTYNGENLLGKSEEEIKRYIFKADSPLNAALGVSEEKGLIATREANKIRDNFASLVHTAIKYGANGIGAIDTVWRWKVYNDTFRPVKKNGDHQYSKSIDISTVCKKTEQLLKAISEFQVKHKRGATALEILELYRATGEEGFQTPCPVCYVFSHWLTNGIYTTSYYDFQNKYREQLSMLGTDRHEEAVQFFLDAIVKENKKYNKASRTITAAKKAMSEVSVNIDNLIIQYNELQSKNKSTTAVEKKIAEMQKRFNNAVKTLQEFDQHNIINQVVFNAGAHKTDKNFDGTLNKGKSAIEKYDFIDDNVIFDYTKAWMLTDNGERDWTPLARYRSSKGSGYGKQIQTETNNNFGDVLAGLSVGDPDKAVNPFNNYDGSEKSKKEIKTLFDKAIRFAKEQSLIGGARLFSWSDNQTKYGLDMFMNFAQLQMIGSSVQSYTKQLEGLALISSMEGYVNGSLMAYGDGYKTDSKGKKYLVFSTMQGINPEMTFEICKKFDRAGNILVGMNDTHIQVALADDRIYFVIPWHSSGLNSKLLNRMFDILGESATSSTDYSKVQGESSFGALTFSKNIDENKTFEEIAKEEKEAESNGKKTKEEIEEEKRPVVVHKLFDEIKAMDKNNFASGMNVENGTVVRTNGKEKYIPSESQMKYRKLRYKILSGQTLSVEEQFIVSNDLFLNTIQTKLRDVGLDKISNDHIKQIFPYEYWDESSTYSKADINGVRYLEYCRRLGVKPKFCGLTADGRVAKVNVNGKSTEIGAFHKLKGYWKLLIDRRMYNNKGKYQGTTTVRADKMNPESIIPIDKDGKQYMNVNGTEVKVSKSAENNPEAINRIVDNAEKYATEHYGVEYKPRASISPDYELRDDTKTYAKYSAIENPGININNISGDVDAFKNNKKTMETRTTRNLDAFIGKRIALIESGLKGGAEIFGYATVDGMPEVMSTDNFNDFVGEHNVSDTSKYYPKKGTNSEYKYGYRFKDITILDEPIKIGSKYSVDYTARDLPFSESTSRASISEDIDEELEISDYRTLKTGYENVTDSLLGFSKDSTRNKGFEETKYPYTLNVWVSVDDGYTYSKDAIKGMNRLHAIERARRNWGTTDDGIIIRERTSGDYTARDLPFSESTSRASISEEEVAPTFYSKMEQVIDGIKENKIGADSVVNRLKRDGVKDEEIKWSGIETFIDGKKSVTKEELQEFVRGNSIEIEEKNLKDSDLIIKESTEKINKIGDSLNTSLYELIGETIPADFRDGNPISLRLENLLEEKGLSNTEKAEEIMSLAEQFDDVQIDLDSIYLNGEKKTNTKWKGYSLYGGENYREILFKLPNSDYQNRAMEVHWGESGVLAHARMQDMNTSDGNKMLFIEEIQSDWHNAGNERGYQNKSLYTKENTSLDFDGTMFVLYDSDNEVLGLEIGTGKEKEQIFDKLLKNANEEALKYYVPDAPFKKTYTDYAIKRLLREASESGYDSIGWTTAEQQSKRWSDEFAEGYRIEYDQDIPKFLNKYGKKWGGKATHTTLENGETVWEFVIPEEMKKSVVYEGQPRFSVSEEVKEEAQRLSGELQMEGREKFKGTQIFEKLGVKISNSVGMYDAVANEREYNNLKADANRTEKQFKKDNHITYAEEQVVNEMLRGNINNGIYNSLSKDRREVVKNYYELRDITRYFDGNIEDTVRHNIKSLIYKYCGGKVTNPKSALLWQLQALTPKRVARKVFSNGDEIYKQFFQPIRQNNGEMLRFNQKMLDKVEKFKDSNGKTRKLTKDERSVAQKILEDRKGEIKKEEKYDKVIVNNAVAKYREVYADMYELINDFLLAHGMKEIGFITNYAPHFKGNEENFNLLEKALGTLGANVTELPTAIAGKTSVFKPDKKWVANFLERTGDKTTFDVAKGFENYITAVSQVIYHTDDIMKLRQMEQYIRDNAEFNLDAPNSDNYVLGVSIDELRKFVGDNRIDVAHKGEKPTRQELVNAIEKFLDESGEAKVNEKTNGSEFVQWLQNFTNILAGKQTVWDRGAEGLFGRKSLRFGRKLQSYGQVAKVAGNLSSAVQQISQIPFIRSELGAKYTAKAIKSLFTEEGRIAIENSDFLMGKRGLDFITTTVGQMIVEKLFIPAEFVDSTISSVAFLGDYMRSLDKGMSVNEALIHADEFASDIMGSRMKGEKPSIFENKDPLSTIVNMFQVEQLNTFEHLIDDLPNDFKMIRKDKGTAKALASFIFLLLKIAIGSFVTNRLAEDICGGTPSQFDLLGYAANFTASGEGLSTQKWITRAIDDTCDLLFQERPYGTDDTEVAEFDVARAFESLGENVLSDTPILSNVAGAFGIGDQTLDIPVVTQAIDIVSKAINGNLSKNDWIALGTSAIPGGSQISKTVKAVDSLIEGGSYSNKGKLQFTAPESFSDIMQSLMFGKYATDKGQNYLANRETYSDSQTSLYKDLIAEDVSISNAEEIINMIEIPKYTQYKALMSKYRLTAKQYARLMASLKDTDNSGSFSQEEYTEAIDKLGLTDRQKSAVWQCMTGATKSKNNPYDTEVGDEVIKYLDSLKTKTEKRELKTGYELTLGE